MGGSRGRANPWLTASAGVAMGVVAVFFIGHLFIPAVPSPPHLLANAVFAHVPMTVFTITIRVLGSLAQPLTLLLSTITVVGIAVGLATRIGPPRRGAGGPTPETPAPGAWLRVAGAPGLRLSGAAVLLLFAVLYPPSGKGWLGLASDPPWAAVSGGLLGAVLYGFGTAAGARWLERRADAGEPTRVEPQPEPRPEPAPVSRRALLKMGLALTAGSAVLFAVDRWVFVRQLTADGVTTILPLNPSGGPAAGYGYFTTPNSDFYNVSIGLHPPRVLVDTWRLDVEGHVEQPYTVTYQWLAAQPAVEQWTTLICVSNPIGGRLISNARWRGVPLRELLLPARLREGAVHVVFHCLDGYHVSIPMERALAPYTLLVLGMNGDTLPLRNGFPARILVPGIYGMMHAKWVRRIEVVDHEYQGYWQRRGWTNDGTIRTMSRIDRPGSREEIPAGQPTRIAGIAFAGLNPITRVDVRIEGEGEDGRWRPAELEDPEVRAAWRFWSLPWTPPGPGSYALTVRTADAVQGAQREGDGTPLPAGAEGWHRTWVRAV